jgi:ABC-2 type transport system ATP-binding protein
MTANTSIDASADAVVIRGLTKRYGSDDDFAVDGLDLTVPRGAVFGLVGGNGSGKTTTLRTLLGLVRQDGGEATVFGEDSRRLSKAVRQRIGYLSENEFPYDDIAIVDALRFVRGFFDAWDWDWVDHLVERLGVDRRKRLDGLSKGQRRLAEVLLAVAPSPDLLVLDDPAIGLDPSVRRSVLWTLLETVQERGTTVLFSSHILQDVERVVDHVGILQNGRMRVAGEIDDVKERVRRIVLPKHAAPTQIDGELCREELGSEVAIVTGSWTEALAARYADATAIDRLNLEEMFLSLAGEEVSS